MADTDEYPGPFDSTSLISVLCATLAAYNALELILLIFTTFKVYNGLYFWSILIATVAIIPYVIGMELMFFDSATKLGALIINNIGWISMVVAQSVVLYSRLGIVLGNQNSRILLFTKWMIIIDAIVFYTLATGIVFGMHYSSNPNFDNGYIYVERLQMTGFCIQEFIISGLYIWKTLDILKAGEKRQARRTLWQLFVINIFIVGLDVALLVLEYLGLATIQISFKALAYSVKLKMEFAILSKLVESSNIAQQSFSMSLGNQVAPTDNQSIPTSPHFVTSVLSQWRDNEKGSGADHAEYQSFKTNRSQSHQTDNSDPELCRTRGTSRFQSASTNPPVDPYHEMVRIISKAE